MPPAKRATRATVAPDDLRPAPVVLVTGAESVLADRAVAALVAAARAGDPDLTVTQVDAAAYAFVKRTPSAINRSMFGVLKSGRPYALTSP